MELFHIDMIDTTFVIEAKGGKITDAAPVASWMIGKNKNQIGLWLLKKRAKVKKLKCLDGYGIQKGD